MGLKIRINKTTMDDNWGNILYIILMVLFVIIGALKKKKKPVRDLESFTAERAEDEMPSNLENIFDTLLGANAFTPEEQELYKVQHAEEIEAEDNVETSQGKVIESVEYDSPKVVVVEKVEDEQEEEEERFDWRQAIIYKEILDRKYI